MSSILCANLVSLQWDLKKKNVLHSDRKILSYSCEIWTEDYRLKKKLLSTKMDFRRRAARTSRILVLTFILRHLNS
jgi:hypothetical protein